MVYLDPLDRLRLQRGCERIGGMPCILGLLNEYRERLSPHLLRAAGGHKFPKRPLRVVPR